MEKIFFLGFLAKMGPKLGFSTSKIDTQKSSFKLLGIAIAHRLKIDVITFLWKSVM